MFMLLCTGTTLLATLALLITVRPQTGRPSRNQALSTEGAYFEERI